MKNQVHQPTAAGELSGRRSPHLADRRWARVARITVPLIALLAVLAVAAAPALAGEQWAVGGAFGAAPADPAPLSDPAWVAVNQSTGDVYVVDKGNDRVEYFSATGAYLGQFNGAGTPAGSLLAPGPIVIDDTCSLRGLSEPQCNEEDPSNGDVYVIDTGHDVIDKFTAGGVYLGQITTGEQDRPFKKGELLGMAVDQNGRLWIDQAEEFNDTADPIEFDEFSNELSNELLAVREGIVYYPGPGLALDSEGNLYIGSSGFYGVQEFNPKGETISRGIGGGIGIAGLTVDPRSNDLYIDTGASDSEGTGITVASPLTGPIESFGAGLLSGGGGLAVDSASGDVYVAEAASNSVIFFEHSATPQNPPSAPSTNPATEATATSAKLSGELNPEGVKGGVGYYFSYNIGSGSSCTGPGSVKTAIDDGAANVTGSTETPVSISVKGLEPDEEYVFCLVADKYGSTAGPPVSFTTGMAAPEIISESAHNPEYAGEGQFAAVINPDHSKQETTYSFEYSTEGSVTANTLGGTIETAAGEGTRPAEEFAEATVVSVPALLKPIANTFYYRVRATNETGTTIGKVQAYTKLPEVESESASKLSLTGAALATTINPVYQPTRYYFEYSGERKTLEEGKGTRAAGEKPIDEVGEEPEDQDVGEAVEVVIIGLQPHHVYYYRAVAENESSRNTGNLNKGEPVGGEIKQFTTETLPFLGTGEAGDITRTTATLSGTVTAPVANAKYYFQYISATAYQAALARGAADPYEEGETTTPLPLAASEQAQTVGPVPISGLLPGETYYYRLVGSNAFGSRFGEENEAQHTFKTLGAAPPIVSTGGVSGVSQNSATLSGTISTNGLQTNYGFEIGTEPGSYGPATGLGAIGGSLTEAVSVTLGELQPGTTYYYRVTATNADGTVQGQPVSFTTPGFPTLIAPPASPPLIAAPNIAFPKEEPASGTTTTPKALTNAQKLSKALKACKKDKKKDKRVACERQAEKKYPTTKKKAKKK